MAHLNVRMSALWFICPHLVWKMRHPKSSKSYLDFIDLLLKHLNEKISENASHTICLGKWAWIPLQEKIRDVYFNTFFVFFIPWNNLHNATIIPPRDKNLKIIFLYVNTEKLGCLMYQLFESWGCLGKSWERKVKTNAGLEEGSDSTKL